MIKKISYNEDEELKEELDIVDEYLDYDLNALKSLDVINTTKELQRYNNILKKIPKTRKHIETIKHTKDLIIHNLIDKIEPPYYLRVKDINYRAIVSHYLLKFINRTRIILKLDDFLYENIDKKYEEELQKIFCGKGNTITILTNIENIFHLMDFKKDKKTHEYLGDILYEKLKIHDNRHLKDVESFKSKIASLPWLINTIKKPDLIYNKDADLTKSINPDLVFVRETGDGSNKEQYMHHYVALTKLKNKQGNSSNPSVYKILSQFGLKQHTSSKLSYLYKKVKVNNEIYKRKG